MAAPCFISWSGLTTALSGTTIIAAVATSAVSGTVKTIQQVKTNVGKIRVIEWGYILETTPTAPITVELIDTGAIGATVTQGSTPSAYNDASGAASNTAAVGTASTGFSGSAEGTITATRLLAMTYDTSQYFKQQFPLGREPEVSSGGGFLRVRATPNTGVSINMVSYIIWEE